MKVGKPQSKRVTVRLRHRIQKASASKQRKDRKAAKKNPQWRSRLKKDPGIPNLFPYKAKMLAEIEEGKRRKEEDAQRRRDVAKAQRQGKTEVAVEVPTVDDDEDEILEDNDLSDGDEDETMQDEDDGNPMAALLASAQSRAQAYAHDDEDENEGEDDDEEWNGIEDTVTPVKSILSKEKVLPKQALADPIKAVSALLDRMQKTTDGIQRLVDHYQMLPLVTAGSDLTSRFLVEVARKRGRLGRGGVPNLHSAALTVLSDLNEERLLLPAVTESTTAKSAVVQGKGEVQVVAQMAQPFRIEGLWGDDGDVGGVTVGQEMVVEA